MAMTYSDTQFSIEQNMWFRSRVRVAVSTFSNYLLNTPEEDPDHQPKVDAGIRLAQQIESVMQTLMFTLAGDAEVQAEGPAITDSQLQQIVEKTINKFWPVVPGQAAVFSKES